MRIKHIVTFNQGRDETWGGIGVLLKLKSSAKQSLCMSVRSRLVGKCIEELLSKAEWCRYATGFSVLR